MSHDFETFQPEDNNNSIGNPVTLACGTVALLAMTSVLAVIMLVLYVLGFEFVIASVLVGATIVGGLARLVIRFSHCRNQTAAALLGLTAAALLIFGKYQIALCIESGVGLHRVELLPGYLAALMEEQTVGDTLNAGFLNWALFALETVIGLGVAGAMARDRAGHSFCDSCQKWQKRQTVKFRPGSVADVVQGIRTGDFSSLQQLVRPSADEQTGAVELVCEYCPDALGEVSDCPASWSLKDYGQGNLAAMWNGHRTPHQRVSLDGTSRAAVLPLFFSSAMLTVTENATALAGVGAEAGFQPDPAARYSV